MLSDDEIKTQIEMATSAVTENLKKLGIDPNKMKLNCHCQVTPTNFNAFDYDDEECDDSSDNESVEECDYLENSNDSQDAQDTTLSGITGWCMFEMNHKIVVGLVLSFAYLNGKTLTERVYTKSTASIQSRGKPVMGVLGSWYSWNDQGLLNVDEKNKIHKCIPIEFYRRTIR